MTLDEGLKAETLLERMIRLVTLARWARELLAEYSWGFVRDIVRIRIMKSGRKYKAASKKAWQVMRLTRYSDEALNGVANLTISLKSLGL